MGGKRSQIANSASAATFSSNDRFRKPNEREALTARLRERLAGYKVPARIYVVDAFPVTDSANGVKIQRTRFRAMAMDRIAAE